MPVDRLEPLGTVQKIPGTPLNGRSVTQPTVWFTATSRSKFIGRVQCTLTGGATYAYLRDPTDTFNYAVWLASGGSDSADHLTNLVRGMSIPVEFDLDVGDVIKTTQSSSTNAEFNIEGFVQEN